MHTFLHGWRRKAGVVALVMACLLTSAWLRSFSQYYQQWSWKFDQITTYQVSLWNDDIRLKKHDNLRIEKEWSIGIPYVFAIPLTLTSAYLILWKPRKRAVDAVI